MTTSYGFVVMHFNCPGVVARTPDEPVPPPKFMLEEQQGLDMVLLCPACDHRVILNFREVCDNPAAEDPAPKEVVPL